MSTKTAEVDDLLREDLHLHKIRWFVWAGGQRMPRTAKMIGTWGYDVECACGWKTRTGGATRGYIEQQVWAHKRDLA